MRHPRQARAMALLLTLGLSAGAAACASGGGGGSDSGPRRSANRITMDELAANQSEDALTAVRRLRPRWLQPRGGSNLPVVFLDGARMGLPDSLRSISVADVDSMTFLSPSDATTRYGTNFPGGAIEVRSRTR
ncbi:MAG: hypothetical protein ACR2QM_10675 [Longimicrobiales bacterium]